MKRKYFLLTFLIILSIVFACLGISCSSEENDSINKTTSKGLKTSLQTTNASLITSNLQNTSSSISSSSSLQNTSSGQQTSNSYTEINTQSTVSSKVTSSSVVNAEELLLEQVLNGLVLNENMVAGGELNLQKEINVDGKMVSLNYNIVQGEKECSVVNNKMYFSKPRENKIIKVRVSAIYGSKTKEKDYYINLSAVKNDILYETFDVGSVDGLGANYTGGKIDVKRANSSSSLFIEEYNNSNALKVLCQGAMTYGAYAGFYIHTKPNTLYQIALDLDAIGATTADLSNSDYIHFEVYLNSNMGVVNNRTNLYNSSGKWIDKCPKISSMLTQNNRYVMQFVTDGIDNGYAYFAIKVRSAIGEDLTIYLDNVKVSECVTDLKEDFEFGNSFNQLFNGRVKAKSISALLSQENYGESKGLKGIIESGYQGFLAFKLNVEKNKTYMASFNCDVLGESGINYNSGISEGDSASVFIVANTEDLASSSSRIYFDLINGRSVTNTTLINLLNFGNEFKLKFSATESGFVYLIIRTNKIAEKVNLYVDNLTLIDIDKDIYAHNKMGYLNGLGEPFKASNVQDFDQSKVAELYGMLNVQSSRMWFGTDIFKNWSWNAPLDSFVIDQSVKAGYDKVLQLLKEQGIKEITGMGLYLPITNSTTSLQDNHYVPLINSTDYQVFLDKVYELWYEMAKAFPQVLIWEVGNESNADFLKYKEYKHMSYHERSKVTVDMMYYAYKAIKNANPKAMVITPGFAPVTSYYTQNTNTDGEYEVKLNAGIYSVEIFLKYLYADIVSGKHPYHNGSKYINNYDADPDNYFDGVAWHPYDLGVIGYANTNDPDLNHFDVNLWVEANNACYKVMCNYGDEDKGVWFTEFGIRTKESHLVYSPVSQGSMYEYCVYFAGGTVYYTPDGKAENIVKQKISAGNYYITFYDQENYVKLQETVLSAYYQAMTSNSMSYVHAWHYFRGFGGLKDYSWNGLAGIYCALFSESAEYLNRGYYPNHKAYILQELYGGTGDLMKYSTYSSVHPGDKQVGAGLIETFNNGTATDLSGNSVKYRGDIYAYSSNNNGAIVIENGALKMSSEQTAYLAFKVNGLQMGKSYTISFEISQSTTNTAFCIFTSDVNTGSWNASTRIKPNGTNYEVSINSLTKQGNVYSYTVTPEQNYDSLYFTIRNNGVIVIEEISVTINV